MNKDMVGSRSTPTDHLLYDPKIALEAETNDANEMETIRRETVQTQKELMKEYGQSEPDCFGDWGDFASKIFKPRPPIEYIYEDLIPKGLPGGLFAAGGTGKTFFCLQQVLYGAAGMKFGPLKPTKPLKCVYLCAEDQEKFLLERAEAILNADLELKENFDKAKDNFDIKSLAGVNAGFLRFNGQNIEETEFFRLVIEKLKQKDSLDLVILDPLISYLGLPENESGNGQAMIQCLTKIAMETGASVMVAHHVTKDATLESISKSGGRGTSAIYDGLRWAFGMFKVPLMVTQGKKDVTNSELIKFRTMAGDDSAMFSKFFSVKNNHAKELVSVEVFKRGENGVLESFGKVQDFVEQARADVLEYLKNSKEEFTRSELCDQTKGGNFRRSITEKYNMTKVSFKNLIEDLISWGEISVKNVGTNTNSRKILCVR